MPSLKRTFTGAYAARIRIPKDVRDEYGARFGKRHEAKFHAPASTSPGNAKRLYGEWLAQPAFSSGAPVTLLCLLSALPQLAELGFSRGLGTDGAVHEVALLRFIPPLPRIGLEALKFGGGIAQHFPVTIALGTADCGGFLGWREEAWSAPRPGKCLRN